MTLFASEIAEADYREVAQEETRQAKPVKAEAKAQATPSVSPLVRKIFALQTALGWDDLQLIEEMESLFPEVAFTGDLDYSIGLLAGQQEEILHSTLQSALKKGKVR